MNVIFRSLSAFAIFTSAFAATANFATAQTTSTPTQPQQTTNQRICSFNKVEDLLPTPANPQNSNSSLSYLAQQGFIQTPDGSWACYVSEQQNPTRYYTLFKVQEINGALVATSFLEQGSLIEGQSDRSLELFMTLIQNHTRVNQGNQQSIQRYLDSFLALVQQGKIKPSPRGYLFDQPSGAFVLYHPVTGGELQGTGITININAPQNLASSPVPGTNTSGLSTKTKP